jgi:hypothetical protein
VHPGVPPFTLKLFAGGDEVAAVVFDGQAREVREIENDASEPSLAASLRIERKVVDRSYPPAPARSR